VALTYLSEREESDARHTAELVEAAGRRSVTIRGDLAGEDLCDQAVRRTADELGGLDILVNNVATQNPVDDVTKLSSEQWERTFRVNVFRRPRGPCSPRPTLWPRRCWTTASG
jgi:NAD(P)-dependent dehydrogenase (short-subunit alcohol dehydrogenase family)